MDRYVLEKFFLDNFREFRPVQVVFLCLKILKYIRRALRLKKPSSPFLNTIKYERRCWRTCPKGIDPFYVANNNLTAWTYHNMRTNGQILFENVFLRRVLYSTWKRIFKYFVKAEFSPVGKPSYVSIFIPTFKTFGKSFLHYGYQYFVTITC